MIKFIYSKEITNSRFNKDPDEDYKYTTSLDKVIQIICKWNLQGQRTGHKYKLLSTELSYKDPSSFRQLGSSDEWIDITDNKWI